MKTKRKHKKSKKWTILVMSDANKRVFQLKIPKIFAYIISFLFISISSGLFFSQIMLQQTKQENAALLDSLHSVNGEISSAEETINYYKEEAESLEQKVTRLTELEQELKAMITSLNPELINDSLGSGPSGGLEVSLSHSLASNKNESNEEISQLALKKDTDNDIKNEESLTDQYKRLNESVPNLVTQYESSIEQFSEIKTQLNTTPTYWPADADRITSEFGNRSDPFTTRSAFHTGIDIAGPYGTPIYATADGTVILAGRDGGYGNSIMIKHTPALKTRYGHMSKLAVDEGDKVKKGDIIGYMGSTGRSTGVHLHYEVLQYGVPIDPYPYMTFLKRVLEQQ